MHLRNHWRLPLTCPHCRRCYPRSKLNRTMKTFNIATIAGDGHREGSGSEGIRVLEAAGRRFDFRHCIGMRLIGAAQRMCRPGKWIPGPTACPNCGLSTPFSSRPLATRAFPITFALGTSDPHPARFPAICQSSSCPPFRWNRIPLKNWKPGQIDFHHRS